MKYVKTSDGRICEVPNNAGIILYDNEKLLIDTNKKGQTCVYGIVEKQADTIEKLIDVLICVNKDTGYQATFKFTDKHELYLEDYDWYGAIFAKGEHDEPTLKSVAKYKEEGWVLL